MARFGMVTISVIGSFRKHYGAILAAVREFRRVGFTVESPSGAPIIDPDVEFVRLEGDAPHRSDVDIQARTMDKLLRSSTIYVVAPGGYIGRTTCYEIGRLIQSGQTLYFSERPADLPIMIGEGHICTPEELSTKLIRQVRSILGW